MTTVIPTSGVGAGVFSSTIGKILVSGPEGVLFGASGKPPLRSGPLFIAASGVG